MKETELEQWCVVTKGCDKKYLLFALELLLSKGYNACIRKINDSFYVIRKFKPGELNDKIFRNVHEEFIVKNDKGWCFTKGKNNAADPETN